MNELSIRVEGGWLPPDTFPYNEDLLRHTLGLSPRVAPNCTDSNTNFYPDSEWNQGVQTSRNGALKRDWITEKTTSESRKKTESDQVSIIHGPLKGSLRRSKGKPQDRQLSEDVELPFQQGVPLKEEDDNQKTCSSDREIFMAIISEIQEHNDDPME